LADYRPEEVLYDRIKTGSPFSVSSLLLVLIILPGLVACGNPGGDENHGSVTFDNLPTNYYCEDLEVNTDPSAQPGVDWSANVIGIGEDSPSGSYNVKNITSGTWSEDHTQWNNTSPDFTYTGPASVNAVFSTGGDPGRVISTFNNVWFSGGHAVIDFTAFRIPQTDGKFTLTNIPPEHNGKHAILVGSYGNPPTVLYGIKDATSANALKGFKIGGTTAEIPVFKLDTVTKRFSSYDTTNTVIGITIIIQEDEDFDFLEYSQKMEDYTAAIAADPFNPPPYPVSALVYPTSINFQYGKAARGFDQGTWNSGQ
jgi:hypothetical protein